VFGSNLTPDLETGIGKWTDEQIMRAIREGVRPDGSMIGPPMPFDMYRRIADEDMLAIVAYLRSLPPVSNPVPAAEFGFPLPAAYGPVIKKVRPSRDDLIKYGEYLAGPVGHCIACHTGTSSPKPDDFESRLGAGGRPFGPGGVPTARNITPHQTGLKDWSDADIEKAIRKGIRPDGSRLKPPMPYALYDTMPASDMRAIIAYLRSLKPVPAGGG
jgi:mono/diheme cytochrome c family protein